MKNRKFLAVILAVALLLTFVFVLSACGDNKPEEKPEETTAAVTPELNVSFDETATYAMDDAAISDAISAEIVENGVSRRVAFTVKSSTLTEDGQHIKVVVAAEGIEKEILLPYEAEPEVYIRSDLKPLYELLTKDGDKSFSFEVISVITPDAEGEQEISSFKVLVNDKAEGVEFAFVNVGENSEESVILFKDGVLNLFGLSLNLPDIYEQAAGEEDGEIATKEDIAKMLSDLSIALDSADRTFDNPMFSMMGFTKGNETYRINTDTAKLIPMIQLMLSGNEDIDINDVSRYIDLLDSLLGGALKRGDIKIDLSLSILKNGLSLCLQMRDEVTGILTSETFTFTVRTAPFELPDPVQLPDDVDLSVFNDVIDLSKLSEVNDISDIKNLINTDKLYELISARLESADFKDIRILIPFMFPENETEILIKITVYVTDILIGPSDNYITASIELNGVRSAIFVLNDKYVYLDISGLVPYEEEAERPYVAFYQAFEIDGEPVSVFKYLAATLFNKDEEEVVENSENVEGNDNDLEVDFNDDEYDYYGYGCTTVDGNGVAILPIGATEDDLRAKLLVYVFDEDDKQIFIDDYQIEGFDSSASFHDYVDILFYDIEETVEVVVRDADKETISDIVISPFRVGKGTDVATAQSYIPVEVEMTDGQVSWTVYDGECTIDKVDGADVDAGYVFEMIGNYTLTVTYKATGAKTEAALYVFDPDDLHVEYVEFQPEIYVDQGVTEEELRDYICVRAEYDNGDFILVEDYEIVGFTPGDDVVNVRWNEYNHTINIVYYDAPYNPYGPDDEPKSAFDILTLMQYFRRADLLESEDVLAGIAAIFEQNEELFKSVIAIDEENKTISITLNSKDGGSLLDIVNIFFGIPTEDGFEDISEAQLLDLISSEDGMFNISSMFKKIIGVEISDFLSDLSVKMGYAIDDDKFAAKIELNDGGDVKYFITGIGVGFSDRSSSNFKLTEKGIEDAQSFEKLPLAIFMIFMPLFSA
ncbi:MAG: hypothetical protein J5894_03645 [Clostridia bacterium]|nr:hypothetical protein [Clostridia bacterium]